MCGDWGMCKSNYLLTAVAEREGWEWHRGSSRRWAPSICHSTPFHNPLPILPQSLFCLSVCPSCSHSLCPSVSLSLCLSICLDTCLRSSIIQYDLFLFMINSTDDNLLNVSVPLVLPAGSAKIIILVSSIGWTNRLQTYTIGWVSVDESEQKRHSVYSFLKWIYQWLTYTYITVYLNMKKLFRYLIIYSIPHCYFYL